MNEELQRKHYDNISERYIQARKNENHRSYRDSIFSHVFTELVKKSNKENFPKVLEAMCGNADNSILFLEYFPKSSISGFDYSEKMVEDCKKNFPQINVFHKNILEFDEKNQYDLIILIGGLHHVYKDTLRVLKLLRNSLKEGGYLLNFEPTHNNFLWKYVRERIYKKNDAFEENSEEGYELTKLNIIYNESGFKKVYQIYPGLIGYILYYNPEAFPKLNFGNKNSARFFANFDIWLGKTWLGKKLSFASFSILEK